MTPGFAAGGGLPSRCPRGPGRRVRPEAGRPSRDRGRRRRLAGAARAGGAGGRGPLGGRGLVLGPLHARLPRGVTRLPRPVGGLLGAGTAVGPGRPGRVRFPPVGRGGSGRGPARSVVHRRSFTVPGRGRGGGSGSHRAMRCFPVDPPRSGLLAFYCPCDRGQTGGMADQYAHSGDDKRPTGMPTLRWEEPPEGPVLVLLDQTRLPAEEVELVCTDAPALVEAIRSLAVRGAPCWASRVRTVSRSRPCGATTWTTRRRPWRAPGPRR